MGLSICRSIINAHGGRLWADANEPRGAVFQFTLPSAKNEVMTSRYAAHQNEGPHEDTVSAACHQMACEGNKRRLPSERWLGPRHRDRPSPGKFWSDDAFPFELLPSFKELGLGGLGYQGYGCAGGSQKLFGFVAMELARVDASFCTFFGVHSGLAMGSIYLDGSEEQKQQWLPAMARWEKIGCFGLTEPLVGSGTSGGMTTTAKREGDTWLLNGQKRWIGNATWCDLSIIWARDLADNQVKGFIVENKTTPGFASRKSSTRSRLRLSRTARSRSRMCGCRRRTACRAASRSATPPACCG
jgi:alkylation response protein AidB-like acyl-CoA dehydrogenase